MNVIEGKDLRTGTENREKLQDSIPLDTPYVLFIEPTSICNMSCKFCPTGDKSLRKIRPNGIMSWEIYLKLIKDIKDFNKKLKRINFYKDGESLLNINFCKMVNLAKEEKISESLWLKTNGLLLNPELNQNLINSGLDMIGISVVHVTSDGYKKISGIHIDYEKLKNNIKDLYNKKDNCKIYIKLAEIGFTQSERDKFFNDFGNICDYIAIEGLHGWSKSYVKDFTMGTNSKSLDGIPFIKKTVCPWPFYELAINWNGTVSLCNEDWSHGTLIGDIHAESLKDIWNGEKIYNIQKMMLEGTREKHPVCGDCFYVSCAPDNIDEYRLQILEKIKK